MEFQSHICSGRVVTVMKLNSKAAFVYLLCVEHRGNNLPTPFSGKFSKCHTLLPLSASATYRLGSVTPHQLMSSHSELQIPISTCLSEISDWILWMSPYSGVSKLSMFKQNLFFAASLATPFSS